MFPVRSSILAVLSAVLLVLLMGLLGGCASRPDIRTDKEPGADLRAYRTFAFMAPAADGRTPPYTSLVAARFRQAAKQELEHHGLVYDEHAPDLRVNLVLIVADRQEIRATPAARPHAYRPWAGGLETANYRLGTLAIDLVDTSRNALVWRGVAEGHIEPETMKFPGPAIDAIVGDVLVRFPDGIARQRLAIAG
jgi:type IV pilus biogenesis protein CpaD/CtpE